MRTIKVYCPSGQQPPINVFLSALDSKLRDKVLWQIFRLATIPRNEIKEPHFKHFVIDRYSQLYELREKSRVLVRVIFVIHGENIILLSAFVKHQPRDTMKALEQSLGLLTEIRAKPGYAVTFKIK